MTAPERSLILVIDMQNDFCSEKGVYGQAGFSRSLVKEMVGPLERFLIVAREIRIPLIYTQTVHSEWTDDPVWLSRQGGKYSPHVCRVGSWGAKWFDEAPGIWPRENDYTIIKHRNSAFMATDLELVLRAKGISNIILTGTATNACVEATARDAFTRGFYTVVVDDCTATTTEGEHSSTLQRLRGSGVLVRSSSEVIENWKKIVDLQIAKQE